MMKDRFTDAAYAIATFAVLFIVWEFACDYFEVPTFYIPAPSKIGMALVRGAGLYWSHVWITLYSTLASFAIALVLRIVLGTLVSEIRFLERTILPVLVALQSMPRVALAPIIIVWFGFDRPRRSRSAPLPPSSRFSSTPRKACGRPTPISSP